MKFPSQEDILLNEYNQALGLRNLSKNRIMTFRGLSIGSSFTLIVTSLTSPVLSLGVFFLIVVISGLIISLFFIEFRLIVRLERIDNYCNYLQVIMRGPPLKDKEIEEEKFIPLSFIFDYLKKVDTDLKTVKKKYYSEEAESYLLKEPIEFKDWIGESYNILRLIILLIIGIIVLLSIFGFITGTEIGISWFDIYSYAHLGFGILVFLLLSFIYTIPKRIDDSKEPRVSMFYIFLLSILMLVLWEIFENTFLLAVGIKPRIDTFENFSTDMIFGTLGAGIQYILFNMYYEKKKYVYYGIGAICSISYITYFAIVTPILIGF